MLLSPLASPSRFTPKSLRLPLPPLQHDDTVSCENIDEEEEDAFSLSSDDGTDFDRDLEHEECASSNTSDDMLELVIAPSRYVVDSIAIPAFDEFVSPSNDLVLAPPSRHVEVQAGVEAAPPPPKSLISLTRPVHTPPNSSTTEPQVNTVPEDQAQAHTEPSSTSNSHPFSEACELALPVELIFTIVELAASSHRRTALALCRVSSWVRSAVLPILYGTLVSQGRDRALPFDAAEFYARARDNVTGGRRQSGSKLENPLCHVRSLWLDLPPDRAPHSLDACPRLVQLALPLEAHATICNTQCWFAYDFRGSKSKSRARKDFGQMQTSSLPEVGFRRTDMGEGMRTSMREHPSSSLPTWRTIGDCAVPGSLPRTMPMPMPISTAMRRSASNDLQIENVDADTGMSTNICDSDSACTNDITYDDLEDKTPATPCRSFTVLGQSHPHRWAPLTSSPNGRAFLRGVTHLRILNLCLSHYIPLEYTPNLTHLCIPFFDLRISPSTLSSSPTTFDPASPASPSLSFSSLTGSAATSSFTGLDYILSSPSLQMVVLTLNPRYWRFDELSLKGWALRAMARDKRLYVVAETRDDATRDWEVPRRDWEEEARRGGMSVWEKAVLVRRKFLTRLSRTWERGGYAQV